MRHSYFVEQGHLSVCIFSVIFQVIVSFFGSLHNFVYTLLGGLSQIPLWHKARKERPSACPITRIKSCLSGKKGIGIFLAILLSTPLHADNSVSFIAWINTFKVQARKEGITTKTLERAFKNLKKPLQKVIDLDHNQPGVKLTFDQYYDKRVPPLISKGKKLIKKHRKILEKVQCKYGVPKAILVALWGHETNYGGFTGNTPTIHALATLAHEGRREKLFTKELIHALRIIQEENIPPHQLKGSWAGALGQCQFMPSTFHAYAVDEKEKGMRDIWHCLDDVFGSTANYLKGIRWNSQEPWLYEVYLTKKIPSCDKPLDDIKTLKAWSDLGVRKKGNKALPKKPWKAALIQPKKSKRAFLVFENIHAILDWNRSLSFALSVGLLANQINDET